MPVTAAPEIITLGPNHRLSYAAYGDPNGTPVYYMHGFYGSRIEARLAAEAAEIPGVRLIAADRPGVGRSTAAPDRSLTDWPAQLEALADHLGHDRFRILGVSGGGPFALACGARFGERVAGIALCGSLAPLTGQALRADLPAKYRYGLWAYNRCRPLLRFANLLLYTAAKRSPEHLLRTIARRQPAVDRDLLLQDDIRAVFIASLTEATARGRSYGETELTIFGADWGPLLPEVSVPVTIWHGALDRVVPVSLAHQLRAGMPHSKLEIRAGEGHFSLPIRQAPEILRDLVER